MDIGENTVNKMFFGTQRVTELYIGNQKIFDGRQQVDKDITLGYYEDQNLDFGVLTDNGQTLSTDIK